MWSVIPTEAYPTYVNMGIVMYAPTRSLTVTDDVGALESSGSVALTVHVSRVRVVTPVSGVTSMLVIVGLVLSTVTVASAEPVPLYPSVAVVLQRTVSPGLAMLLVRVRVSLIPTLLPPMNHS